ncbi:NADH:ubiquinone oxidoreductase subunit NDUFA12 [Stakelama tenebrarum]|uniref:NADH:ubiquinone oxidoreductase subunit NDUFA12 n=1 Tax=Stakelama tenebrarum TaxID=2711215 RepID=A0A6G6Y4L7_9SPHN|nr:NADH:ubiquinone oxidoreductase subunit NDUFA12 [Sphingosinithalassobacter tenebrarum]QIG79791.1 NADH:ubiquinone oxidoreductase subunit NDUFA12 [Sphingosinithalassobacter tenebrarum]
MGILKSIFTWWEGATIGTGLATRGMNNVGEDSLGNVYYEGGKDMSGRPRRWVIYNGSNDASRVPPEWFSWLHHLVDAVPDDSMPPRREWQQPPVPNMTGTNLAYRPPGSLDVGGKRVRATGDYEAWTPDA